MEIDRYNGNECERRPRTHGGEYTTEAFDIGGNGNTEREDSDQAVQELSSAEEKTLLGKSFGCKFF